LRKLADRAIVGAMDREPRLKTAIRVAALIRRAQAAGAFALVARKGDPDAGALAVRVVSGGVVGGLVRLFVESRDEEGRAIWREPLGSPYTEEKADEYVARERRIDPDLWVVEIADREGRTFLD
jgi:hypothetical protein